MVVAALRGRDGDEPAGLAVLGGAAAAMAKTCIAPLDRCVLLRVRVTVGALALALALA